MLPWQLQMGSMDGCYCYCSSSPSYCCLCDEDGVLLILPQLVELVVKRKRAGPSLAVCPTCPTPMPVKVSSLKGDSSGDVPGTWSRGRLAGSTAFLVAAVLWPCPLGNSQSHSILLHLIYIHVLITFMPPYVYLYINVMYTPIKTRTKTVRYFRKLT